MGTIKDCIEAIKVSIKTNDPLFIVGQPGVGKTSIVHQVGKAMELDVKVILLSLYEPVDLRGLAVIDNGNTHWVPPEELPKEGKGILLFDEYPQAHIQTQLPTGRLLLDRELGEYKLPEGYRMIATGNRIEDRAGVNEIPKHLESRFNWFELDPPTKVEWTEWASKNDISPKIISFIHFRPELLNKFDARSKHRAQPLPRTWEMASRIYKTTGSPEMIAMAVGKGAETEFSSFIEVESRLPSIDQMLNGATIGEEPSLKYATVGVITDYVIQNQHKDSLKAILEKVATVCLNIGAEFGFLMLFQLFQYSTIKNSFAATSKFNELIDKWGKYFD